MGAGGVRSRLRSRRSSHEADEVRAGPAGQTRRRRQVHHRSRSIYCRHRTCRSPAGRGGALSACPRNLRHRRHGGSASHAGRRARAHRGRSRASRRTAVPGAAGEHGRLADGGAALSGAGGRRGPPRRRRGGLRGRRYARGGSRRRRSPGHHLHGRPGGGRHQRCDRRRSACALGGGPRQHRLRQGARRQGGGRCRLRGGGQDGEPHRRQQPVDRQLPRAARRDRRV